MVWEKSMMNTDIVWIILSRIRIKGWIIEFTKSTLQSHILHEKNRNYRSEWFCWKTFI